MSLKEKVAYLKGLAEGLGLDSETKEGKIISIIIETLSIMAGEIEELSENALDIGEELDAISSDLADVEEFLYGDDDDIDDDDYDDFFDFDDDDEDDDDDHDDECGCGFCGAGSFPIDVQCPFCGVEMELDETDLACESVKCPACGEELEFEFDSYDEDDEDDDE